MTHIYILLDPRTQAIRYVGKAIDLKARYYRHISCSRDDYKGRWLKKLLAQGIRPVLQVVDSLDIGWEERERWWIAHLRKEGHPLTNLCQGGEGTVGRPVSETTREKQRQSHAGQVPCDALRKHMAEYNQSEAAKPYQREHGKTLVLYRQGRYKPHTEATKRKVSEALKHRLANLTPEQRLARVQAALQARGI